MEAYESPDAICQILEGLERGEKAIRDGDVLTHEEAKERWAKWLE